MWREKTFRPLKSKKSWSISYPTKTKKKPLADNALSKALEKRGYHVARRTVAKYREQMNYPVARLRREL